jgi:predicted dienelactone hydrolase
MSYLVRALFLLFLATASLIIQADENPVHVGKYQMDLGELPTGRPAKITLWFPEGQCSALPDQQHCLAGSAITDRTIVFSHGAMGAAENYNWIAEALAAAGYILVGINHYGESWLYGQDTQGVRATAMIWQRPTDVSAIYDALSNRELFQKPVNWSNIIAMGHSSGGQTVAMLAGGRYDLLSMMDFCKTDAATHDHSCDYGIRNVPKPAESFLKKFSDNYADGRVKKMVLIDPTLGYGATPASLATIKIPTLVVGAGNNDFLPWANHGLRYTKGIPNAKSYLLQGQEGHFVFLDSCANDIAVMDVPLCKDREGVDRTATHAALTPTIIAFVAENNINIDAAVKIAEREKPMLNLDKIAQIFIYTPGWVFGLLVGLIIVGLIPVRTREVPVQAVFIMPIVMLMMSLIGTLIDLGLAWTTITFWLLGAASVTLLLLKLPNNNSIGYDQATRKLSLQGSWIPLLIIMAIFCTRYALGMSIGMNLNIVREYYFAPLVSFTLGALSGYFIAQGINYYRAIKRIA